MRNILLLDGVDASIQQISSNVNLDRRTEWILLIDSIDLDGTPQLFIEQGFTKGECSPNPTKWYVVANKCDSTGEILIDDSEIQVESNYFKGNWFRVRVEANGNTTGTITVQLSYKDFP